MSNLCFVTTLPSDSKATLTLTCEYGDLAVLSFEIWGEKKPVLGTSKLSHKVSLPPILVKLISGQRMPQILKVNTPILVHILPPTRVW